MEIVRFAVVALVGAVLGALLVAWSTAAVVLLAAAAGLGRAVDPLRRWPL